MKKLRAVLIRFLGLFRRRRHEAEMTAELQAHLDGLTERNLAKGMSPEEARRAARLMFGGVEQVKEEAREARIWIWLEQFGQDLRYAVRALRKNPVFTTTAVLTLGLGIGVNAALFTVYNALSLQSFPSRAPERLVSVRGGEPTRPGTRDQSFSYADYLDYRERNTVFSGLAAFDSGAPELEFGDPNGAKLVPDPMFDSRRPGTVIVELVSDNFFSVLGIDMQLGRGFLPEDITNSSIGSVIVLSGPFWERRLQGDPNIVGKTIQLGGRARTVVGVAARNFVGRHPAPPAGWLPLLVPTGPRATRFDGRLGMIGRLNPGLNHEQAKANLDLIARQLAEAYPRDNRKTSVQLQPAMRWMYIPLTPEVIATLSPILLLFVLVLVISCTNVANLLLARGVMRQPEIGVRLTLGASRGRMVRQLLTENLLLCFLGGVAGLGFALWSMQLLRPVVLSYLPTDWRFLVRMWEFLRLAPDLRVFACLLGLVLIAGIAAGLAPALHASRANLISTLKAEGSAFGRRLTVSKLRNLLVISQVAVCLVLLGVAAVFTRSMFRARNIDLGFQPRSVLEVGIDPVTRPRDPSEGAAWLGQMAANLKTVPGVTDASAAIGGIIRPAMRVVKPKPEADGKVIVDNVNTALVSAGFFSTYGIPVRLGRGFDDREVNQVAPVAMVSEALARRLWPNQNPIGRSIGIRDPNPDPRFGPSAASPEAYQDYAVIGVTRNLRNDIWGREQSWLFLPLQPAGGMMGVSLRLRSDSPAALAAVISAAEKIGTRIVDTRPMAAWFEEKILPLLGLSALAGILGGLALLMASVGLYGVMAFSVNSRVREIGIRVALGATARRVVALFLRQGLRSIAIGVAIGLVGGILFSLLMSKVQFAPPGSTFDPIAFGVATLVLGGVALLASWLPARRATKVDPMVALRCE